MNIIPKKIFPLIGAGFLVVSIPAFSYTLHDPIVIDGDSDFTSDNGVSNPTAAGTAADPYIITDWEVDADVGDVCFKITNTTKHFKLDSNKCTGATIGVELDDVDNATIYNNVLTALYGSFGVPPSGDGGYAYGMLLNDVADSVVDDNTITYVYGGAGAAGYAHIPLGSDGDPGGDGGISIAIKITGTTDEVDITDSEIDYIYAGAGGAGAAGTIGGSVGGDGGDGGQGGDAYFIYADGANISNILVDGNNTDHIYAGAGAAGGVGANGVLYGGNGGSGGHAGSAVGIYANDASDVTVSNNVYIAGIHGAAGAAGAVGALGSFGNGVGGNGGDGGDGYGIHYIDCTSCTESSNSFDFITAGLGGYGPGSGSNGTNGSAANVQED